MRYALIFPCQVLSSVVDLRRVFTQAASPGRPEIAAWRRREANASEPTNFSSDSLASLPRMAADGARPGRGPLIRGAIFVLIALCMRPLLASVAPVLHDIVRDNGLSSGGANLLTTLPVLCLGLFAPAGPWLVRRVGAESAVIILLLLLAVSALLRGFMIAALILFSTLIAGAANGMLGALLPGLVKQDFPHRVGLMMGLYVTAICLGIAAASGGTVPLEVWLGGSWNWALAAWGIPPVVATVLLWLRKPVSGNNRLNRMTPAYGLWRDKLAWHVTLFMAFQLAITYCAFGWLAPILRDRGLDPASAGLVLSVSMAGQIFASLMVPIWAARQRQQRIAIVATVCVSLAGFLGCLNFPLAEVWYWAVLMGFGQGGMMSLALVIVVLRSPSATVAMALSGMSQSVGYGVASTGPLVIGLFHDRVGHWEYSSPAIASLGILALLFGWSAGGDRQVNSMSRGEVTVLVP
jgi:CP family cyanate transporter-like MFS transporter